MTVPGPTKGRARAGEQRAGGKPASQLHTLATLDGNLWKIEPEQIQHMVSANQNESTPVDFRFLRLLLPGPVR